jgi:protein O-GlcNAc transferase
MKKIISFSLWGDTPMYTVGAIRNADLALTIYPDWICRFYVGSSTPEDIIKQLESRSNCEVIRMKEAGDWTGMFWRFYAADGDDIVISRDADSRLNLREKAAVEEWLSSDKDFHIMRDHPYHGTEILGGMWGARNGILKGLIPVINSYFKGNYWQVDQDFLRDKVYPLVYNNAITHDEFFIKKPFPTRRADKDFVGMAYNEFDQVLHPHHKELL